MQSNSATARDLASPFVGEFRAQPASELVDLDAVHPQAWANLAERAIEPNAFFHPAWARAVSAHARGRSGAQALLAWDGVAQRA